MSEPNDQLELTPPSKRFSRRRLLRLAAGSSLGLLATAVTGYELVEHGVVPGKFTLDKLFGNCSVPQPQLLFDPVGPTKSGTFYSKSRRKVVGYTVAWPPGHGVGSLVPLVVMLHGFGGNHLGTTSGMRPAQLVALRENNRSLPPMALVTVDGGGGYWHPHPNDDPMGMVVNELIPMCQSLGLGRPAQGIGISGISMGGYGAVAIAEHYPRLFRAVAAISPAIWTSFEQSQGTNPGAYSSRDEFRAYDAVTHAAALTSIPVRVASGFSDPFHDGVVALAQQLPRSAEVVFSAGCHTGAFFTAEEPPTMAFLGRY